MKKQIICSGAPAALGPYSQAIEANGMLFVSGQTPIMPGSGEIPEGIAAQTRQTLLNVKAIVTEAGFIMDDIVKCSVYIKDMNEFAEMNAVYKEFFSEPCPARLTIEAARLPKDVKIEIEAIAVR
jgi:2-iminobutanoate/2-iminopropanoate deaminase